MIASTPLTLLLLSSVVLAATAQGQRSSITCYTKYQHDETKDSDTNMVVNYAYSQSEMTHSLTPDGELCSQVGCACYSYRGVCSSIPTIGNQFSPCTQEDQQNRAVKWHRGLTSLAACQRMQQQSGTYQDLTCCYTDRCNNQSGRVTQSIKSRLPLQRNQNPFQQTVSWTPVSNTPLQRQEIVSFVSATPMAIRERSTQVYEQPWSPNSSPSMSRTSNWMKVLALAFGFILMI